MRLLARAAHGLCADFSSTAGRPLHQVMRYRVSSARHRLARRMTCRFSILLECSMSQFSGVCFASVCVITFIRLDGLRTCSCALLGTTDAIRGLESWPTLVCSYSSLSNFMRNSWRWSPIAVVLVLFPSPVVAGWVRGPLFLRRVRVVNARHHGRRHRDVVRTKSRAAPHPLHSAYPWASLLTPTTTCRPSRCGSTLRTRGADSAFSSKRTCCAPASCAVPRSSTPHDTHIHAAVFRAPRLFAVSASHLWSAVEGTFVCVAFDLRCLPGGLAHVLHHQITVLFSLLMNSPAYVMFWLVFAVHSDDHVGNANRAPGHAGMRCLRFCDCPSGGAAEPSVRNPWSVDWCRGSSCIEEEPRARLARSQPELFRVIGRG